MQPAICIPRDRWDAADAYFLALRRKHSKLRGRGALRTVLFWWAVSLFVLFVAFGYLRPVPNGEATTVSTAWAFRDYIGRVVGALPADCAIVVASSTYPSSADPTSEARSASRPPLFMFWFSQESPCGWRSEWWSLVVAFSPDVSPVQKVTLFVLILGLVWLRQQAIERKIDLISFPRNDRHLDKDITEQDPGWAEHPVSRTDREDRDDPEPIYPRHLIVLDPLWNSEGGTHRVRERLIRVSILLSAAKLNRPIELIIDVLEEGAAHGRVGPASVRMRTAAFAFKEEVLDRLWPVDFLIWLLPIIGFIGTIYGISMSLASTKGLFNSQAEFNVEIGKVVDGLAVAFDTTSMALVCAAVLYLLFKRSEAGATDLAAAAEESLANLLVARMADGGTVVPVVPVPIVPAPADADPKTGNPDGPKP